MLIDTMDKKDLQPDIINWIEESCPYPTDDAGYCIGFDPFTEPEMIVDAFTTFGFVIISNVINEQTIYSTKSRIQDWHKYLSSKKDNNGVFGVKDGFIECYHDNILAKARTSYRLYTGHSLIWKTSRLWCTFDRVSYKTAFDFPNYSTSLHVNQNPLKHPKFSYTHGYISISESIECNGNLRLVSGSHRYFDLWKHLAKNSSLYVNLETSENPYSDLLVKNAKEIAVKPGDAIIWDSRLIHSSTINKLKNPRISILVSILPAILQENIRQKRIDSYVTGSSDINRSARLNASQSPRYSDINSLQEFRITEDLDRFGRLLYGLEPY
ncbi:MAG: phytanoyl-CoA dioxygenase family protein [Patescibacteria group bacterium]